MVSCSCLLRSGRHASAYNLISQTCLDLNKDTVYAKFKSGDKTGISGA